MKSFLSLIIILFFFISCNTEKKTNNQIKIENQKVNSIEVKDSIKETKVEGEDFKKFIYDFTADSMFQISRIKFPLEEEQYKDSDYDETEVKNINKNEWKHLILFLGMSYNLQLYDNYECKLKDSDERVYSYEGVENGINVNYYFKRINGKWYLIKIEDFST